ncbi:MAG: hypothetical protein ACE3L7_13800 [Candidatus Pristimantibacillus sp.]
MMKSPYSHFVQTDSQLVYNLIEVIAMKDKMIERFLKKKSEMYPKMLNDKGEGLRNITDKKSDAIGER